MVFCIFQKNGFFAIMLRFFRKKMSETFHNDVPDGADAVAFKEEEPQKESQYQSYGFLSSQRAKENGSRYEEESQANRDLKMDFLSMSIQEAQDYLAQTGPKGPFINESITYPDENAVRAALANWEVEFKATEDRQYQVQALNLNIGAAKSYLDGESGYFVDHGKVYQNNAEIEAAIQDWTQQLEQLRAVGAEETEIQSLLVNISAAQDYLQGGKGYFIDHGKVYQNDAEIEAAISNWQDEVEQLNRQDQPSV